MSKQSRKTSKPAPIAPGERTFHSFDGSEIRVAHPDGSVAVVGATPRMLPKKLWKAAIRAGCQTNESAPPAPITGLTVADDAMERKAAIIAAMKEALEADEDDPKYMDAFTADELPSVRWLESKVKFPLSADERDAAWAEVQALLETDEAETDDDDGEGDGE